MQETTLKQKNKITFKQLSNPLKISFIGGWIVIIIYCLALILGMLNILVK